MVDVAQLRTTQAASNADYDGGAWADAPALAASTVGMTNTSGRTISVYIAGAGTITVVKVDEVTTGLISTTAYCGMVILRPGAVLKITYSVAPTLHWIFAD